MSANGEDQVSLFDRIEVPSIPKEAGKNIALLERQFEQAEVAQLRASIPLFRPLYAKRNALVASEELQKADFWPRVFANAPAEIDNYVLPSDAEILGSCLKNVSVEHFELNDKGEGEPRSVRLEFDFADGEENEWFKGGKIVKEFYWRKQLTKTPKGKRRTWEGLVSEPVRIQWKDGQDPTKGLLDAACDLAEAEKKKGGKVSSEERTKLPEYEKLVEKVAQLEAEQLGEEDEDDEDHEGHDHPLNTRSPAGVSFFAVFGYRGNDVTAEESVAAEKEDAERWAKIEKGEEVDEDEDDEEDDEDDDEEDDSLVEAEIFPDGEELAMAIAEDLWPNALKYYVQSYEVPDDFDDEMDIEDLDDLEDDEEENVGAGEEDRPRKKVKT